MKVPTPSCALVLALVLAACSSSEEGPSETPTGPSTPTGTTTSEVRVIDFQFSPSVLQIRKGNRVIWKNAGGAAHTTTANGGEWDSGSMPAASGGGDIYDQPGSAGGSYTRSFNETGAYEYRCSFHPSMTGRIVVSD